MVMVRDATTLPDTACRRWIGWFRGRTRTPSSPSGRRDTMPAHRESRHVASPPASPLLPPIVALAWIDRLESRGKG